MPSAASVPISVDRTAARSVISRVVANADMIFWLLKQFMYQSSVKPPHVTRDLELLKERTISTTMGRYRNRKINPI
jgi:hypothetical protein